LKINFNRSSLFTATGAVFIIMGLLGFYFFIVQGKKPDWLQLNVLTLYSQYLETKTFAIIQNNQGDELAVACYGLGMLLIIYKKKGCVRGILPMSVMAYILGYLFLHGLVVIYFTFIFLFILPIIFVLLNSYESPSANSGS